MEIKELLKLNRTFRRFEQSPKPTIQELTDWVGSMRFTASGRNAQPLKYIIVTEEELCHKICASVGWAGYLKDWAGPQKDEEPTAYLVQLLDKKIAPKVHLDEGLQLEALSLLAREAGFGTCILSAFSQKEIKEMLKLEDDFQILSILAIGSPKEEVIVVDLENPDDSVAYYRDEEGKHYVPKRKAEELVYQVLK